jgi:putative oxidoreductase
MLIGLLFFAGGLSMLFVTGPTVVADGFTGLGIPLAGLVVWIVIAVKVIAGFAIILGYRVGLAAAVLILFTFGATITAHRDFADPNLLKNLAIIGGLLYLMAYGPGGSNTTTLSSK